MRQGATSQNNKNQMVNMSQNLSTSYQASRKQNNMGNQNTSYHQNTEISYQPQNQRQPSQKSRQNTVSRNMDQSLKNMADPNSSQVQYVNQGRNKYSNKNVMLQSQQMIPPQSQNQSINQQMKYSTPTHQLAAQQAIVNNNNNNANQKYLVNQNNAKASSDNANAKQHKKETRKQIKYNVTLRLLEGKILIDCSGFIFTMSTYLTVELEKGKQQFKTQQLSGKNPKWNEDFKFEMDNKGDKVTITLYNKFKFQKEDKLGYLVFSLEKLENYNTTDWFIFSNDENQQIASVLINLTSEKIKDSTGNSSNEIEKLNQRNSESEDGDLDANDVDEDLEQSLDYRDHEISRSLIPKNQINERSFIRNGGVMSSNGHYKGLHTQQQQQSSSSYLHTQANYPRQSVTENSVIRHSSHSSNSDAEIDSPNKPGKHQSYYQHNSNQNNYNRDLNNKSKLYNNTGGGISRNMRGQNFPPNFTADDEQLHPQQLQFYAKNQNHSNSSNNLMLVPQQQQLSQNALHMQQHKYLNNHLQNVGAGQNSQYLYYDESSHNGNGLPQVGHDGGHKKHKKHCKLSKERSGRRSKEKQNNHKLKQQMPLLEDVQQMVENIEQNLDSNEDDEVNYGLFQNQRSQNQYNPGISGGGSQIQQPISTSHSQQLLSAFTRNHGGNYDSGGATSNSGGQQYLYQLTGNMGLSGSGGNSLGIQGVLNNHYAHGGNGGSSGSYLPGAPSNFEDQNSIESMNDNNNGLASHNIISGSAINQQMMIDPNLQGLTSSNLYDVSEIQDIIQAKQQLIDQNLLINEHEKQIQQYFASYNQQKAALKLDIKIFQEQKDQFEETKQKFQIQHQEFNNQKRILQQQQKEFNYQKEQLERRFSNMKKERALISQKSKSMDDIFNQFSELINQTKILKNPQMQPIKIDETIAMMKAIHYNLQTLISSDKYQELDRLMTEEHLYQQQQHQQQIQGHVQQESTSSCATNSMGNLNYLISGGKFFNPNQKSPHNQNSSPNQNHRQQHQIQQNISQQLQVNHIPKPQRRQNSNNHLQIGSSNQSQSSPKVIADIINTEEEVDFLDQDEYFKKLSPKDQFDIDNDLNDVFNSNGNKQQMRNQGGPNNVVDKQKFFMKGNKGHNHHHFLNEQHELSTIMEKELLTSQRRSSNGGGGMGTSATMENLRATQLQQQQQQFMMQNQMNNSNIIGTSQFNPSTSAFQTNIVDSSNRYMDHEEVKTTNLNVLENPLVAAQLAQFEGLMKIYEDKLANISKLEEKLLKKAEDMSQQQQQQQPLEIHFNNQSAFDTMKHDQIHDHQQDDIVHITANDVPTNHNVSYANLSKNITSDQQQQQLQQQQFTTQQQTNQSNKDPEESFDFKPDPNFLMKINQNIANNVGQFGQKILPPNDNMMQQQPLYQQLNNSSNIQQQQQFNPQLFYNGVSGEEDEDDYGEEIKQDHQQQHVIIDQELDLQLNNYVNEDPNNNMLMLPDGQQITQEEFLQLYGGNFDMNIMGQQQNYMTNFDEQQNMDPYYQNQMVFDPNLQLQQFDSNDQNQYRDFNDALNDDHSQGYEFNAGTIMHNNQLLPPTQNAQQLQQNEENKVVVQQHQLDSNNIQQASQEQQQVKTKKPKLPEEEIIRLINETYEGNDKDVSVIMKDGKVYDQPKKAQYGIQKSSQGF